MRKLVIQTDGSLIQITHCELSPLEVYATFLKLGQALEAGQLKLPASPNGESKPAADAAA